MPKNAIFFELFEKVAFNGLVNEDSYTRHEHLMEDYRILELRLNDLRKEFENFLSSIK